MGTRKRYVKVTKTFHGGHTFCSSDKLPEGTLSTKQDIIDQVLSKDHFFSMNAARIVAAELVKHWLRSNVYPIHELTAAEKIFNMMIKFKAVDHTTLRKKVQNDRMLEKKATL